MQFIWTLVITFMQVLERYRKCVLVKGDYFPGK